MDFNQTKNVIQFERNLKVGDVVEARWTGGGHEYQAKAEISKLNEKSFRVTLLVEVKDGEKIVYPKGWSKIRVPRILAGDEWNTRNGVFPLESENGGPKYRSGDVVDGKKVRRIFLTVSGYEYEYEA